MCKSQFCGARFDVDAREQLRNQSHKETDKRKGRVLGAACNPTLVKAPGPGGFTEVGLHIAPSFVKHVSAQANQHVTVNKFHNDANPCQLNPKWRRKQSSSNERRKKHAIASSSTN